MAVAIDTSVLVAWEKGGSAQSVLLKTGLDGPFYVPAHAAAEFLVGTHPPVRLDLRERAKKLYEIHIRDLVDSFDEADAAQLALLTSQLRVKGQQMKWYDLAIAATVLSRGDDLLTSDSDFDRLADRITIRRL